MLRKQKYLIIILILFNIVPDEPLEAQDAALVLENMYNRIIRSDNDNEKQRINDSIRIFVKGYASSDSVLRHNFKNLRYLGQILSPDSKLKILTWNLILNNGENLFFSYIIRKMKDTNKVYEITAKYSGDTINTENIYTPENWYGALYYAVQPFRRGKETYYLVLGLNYGNTLITRKIIDVLYFRGDELLLGESCFRRDDRFKFREVLEYSADGLVSLRINSSKMVVFDSLENYSQGHETYGSENYGAGSVIDAYLYKKGSWIYTPDVNIKNRR